MTLRTLALCIKNGAIVGLMLAMSGCVVGCNVAVWKDDPALFGLMWLALALLAGIGWAVTYLDENQ